ncbi:MAG: RIP metalloprotease RseP [Alphaproteobacteria bacterium]|nr:RIP metalloprotease RseP [Alphaproteobacteria bacterium]
MSFLLDNWTYPVAFLVVLSVLIFFHELGHYLVARWNGVRVEVFSIGFGREIWGWTDRVGTRWKVGLFPVGGYVKMFGDQDETSRPSGEVATMTAEERAVSFHHKTLGQRAAIVSAGPIANFLLAVVLFAIIFVVAGKPSTPALVGDVRPDSAAAAAGFKAGDRILRLDGTSVERFEDIVSIVRMNPGKPMEAAVERGGMPVALTVTPLRTEITDRFGNKHVVGQLGIVGSGQVYLQLGPGSALVAAVGETWSTVVVTLKALGQIIAGTRSADELGGPIRIAKMSGDVAQVGIIPLLMLMAVLSVNLGLLNLFPVPMLDGGHLLFYAYEAVRGRPLGERAQEYGFRVGLALVLALMVFVTWNDIVQLF